MSDLRQLDYIAEPLLTFGKGQMIESPKDGLYLFGPLEEATRLSSLRTGVIGTKDGINHFRQWVRRIQGFIPAVDSNSPQHRPYPGFGAIFGIEFPTSPVCELTIEEKDIDDRLMIILSCFQVETNNPWPSSQTS